MCDVLDKISVRRRGGQRLEGLILEHWEVYGYAAVYMPSKASCHLRVTATKNSCLVSRG
jgi:hypothetical protein